MSESFAVGDVVQLKSGGPLMTVVESFDDVANCILATPSLGIVKEQIPFVALRTPNNGTIDKARGED